MTDQFDSHPILSRYEPVIGLEVHCQLNTKTKLFCSCSTEFGALPNHHTCPVCLGMPGVLPVLNTAVVDSAIKVALALDCEVQDVSVFSRKQYFYPDLPKGYQISQYDLPYALGGGINLSTGLMVELERIHIEEDAGKNVHGDRASFVDLNRAGIPLLEIVTKPIMHLPSEAVEYLKKLHAIVTHIEVCDGNMEQGSFRCDANISLRNRGETTLGTKCEIKNLNSFRNIEKALQYEIARQADLLDSGDKILQETRLFDAASGKTNSMRSKEDAHDYRYFPDPDLGPLKIQESRIQAIRATLPELPSAKRTRFEAILGLSPDDAELLTSDKSLCDYFETALGNLSEVSKPKDLSNWITTDLLGLLNHAGKSIEDPFVTPRQIAELVNLISGKKISGKIAKKVLIETSETGKDPETVVKEKGLLQIDDPEVIASAITKVLQESPEQVAEYLSGKEKVFGFFVGKIMKSGGGKFSPDQTTKELRKQLDDLKKTHDS